MSFIGAYTQEDLTALARQVPAGHQVLYKSNTDDWFKALNDYEWGKTITDSSTDVALKREGILNAFFPKTDPQAIIQDFLDWHKNQAVNLTRNMVKLHYADQVETLKELSKQYTAASTSVARKSFKVLSESVQDPYQDTIKTMLNISKASDYRLWMEPQNTLDSWVSRAFGTFEKMKATPATSSDLLAINEALASSGYRGPLYKAETVLAANHSAPVGVLSDFVRRANSVATNFMLRLDSMQALNNAFSTNILLSSEMNYLIGAIKKHPEAAGKLDELMKTTIPGSTVSINTPAKLIASTYPEFFADLFSKDKPLLTRYGNLGWLPSHTKQLEEALEASAIPSQITPASVSRLQTAWEGVLGKGEKAIQAGELYTGNKHSELMGRFAAARIGDKITSLAVEAGILTPSEALVATNSFINKIHGSTLASQRPVLFQGAVGQAISLFQSYQFNLMQQLFKYVGDGQTKSAAILLGMQTAIYGVQGFPAFNALNTYIIGNASGNVDHRDIYSETYNTVGKQAGNWLLYGLASNILGVNIYSRGDLQPRQTTIVPVNPVDIPFVALSAKFASNAYDSLQKLGNGAPVGAVFLQGLEHAGINRPLAGIAATLQGYTTTGQGSLISKTRTEDITGGMDYHAVANLGRILGAKPLDEAILLDANYRYATYRSHELDLLKGLGSAVKSKILTGSPISEEDMTEILVKYQKAGGRQETFNKTMMRWYKDASQSTVNQIADNLNSGNGRYLQRVLAGSTGMPD